jgi:tricorn protease-like protein
MINENQNAMFREVQGKKYYSRHQSYAIRSTKSYYLSSRSLQPSNNRLKLTAHLEKIVSARSLA